MTAVAPTLDARPPQRRDDPTVKAETLARWLLFGLLLYNLVVSPILADLSSGPGGRVAGNLLNQAVTLLLFAGALPLLWKRRERVWALVRGNWALFLLLLWCAASTRWALDSGISTRRVMRLYLMTGTALAIVACLPSPKVFIETVLTVMGIVLVAQVLSPVISPGGFLSSKGEFVGIYNHKNTAGSISMIAGTFWIHALSRPDIGPKRFAKIGFVLLSMATLLASISKMSIPILFFVVPAMLFYAAAWRGGVTLFTVISMASIALGAVLAMAFAFFEVETILAVLIGDPTLTGRTGLWDFILHQISLRPLAGSGYGSFWAIGGVSPAARFDNQFIGRTGQGHNGYLDILLTLGFIGLTLMIAQLLITFFRIVGSSVKAPFAVETSFNGLWMLVFVVVVLHNLLESSILRAGNNLWLLLLFVILFSSSVFVCHRRSASHGP